jgi:cysteine-rich repeat protein
MNRGKWIVLASMFVLGTAACSAVLGIDGKYEDCICGDGFVCSIEQCDDGNTSDADRCSSACVPQEVVEISAGYKHTCARLNNGSVKCWGSNLGGQLGFEQSSVVDAGSNDASVDDAGVEAPGADNAWGNDPNEMGSHLPVVDLGEGRTALKIAAGYDHTCAILNGGDVTCWGNVDCEVPDCIVDLGLDKNGARKAAEGIVAGNDTTCIIVKDRSVLCWGKNDSGQLGSSGPGSKVPQLVNLGEPAMAIAIAGSDAHTCALLQSGAVKCWGANNSGQLGIGNTDIQAGPVGPVDFKGKAAIALAAGRSHTCALLEDDSLWCWGAGTYGALGIGVIKNMAYPTPQRVDLGTGYVAKAIAAGENHTCAILGDGAAEGSIRCWGYNNAGQLGTGMTQKDSFPSPVIKLGTEQKAVAITAGQNHTCTLLDEGSVKCWGSNASGQLGLSDDLLTVKLFSDKW